MTYGIDFTMGITCYSGCLFDDILHKDYNVDVIDGDVAIVEWLCKCAQELDN